MIKSALTLMLERRNFFRTSLRMSLTATDSSCWYRWISWLIVPSLAPSFLWFKKKKKKRKKKVFKTTHQRSKLVSKQKSYLRSSITLACSFSSLISTTRLLNFLPRPSITWFPIPICRLGSMVSYSIKTMKQTLKHLPGKTVIKKT